MGHRYRSYGKGSSLKKKDVSKTLMKQLLVCIVIVLVVILAKKMDTAITNKTMDVFASHMTKDYSVSELAQTAQETFAQILGIPAKMGETIETSQQMMAFTAPTDSAEVISVFGPLSGWSGQEETGFERGMKFDASAGPLLVYASAGGTIEEINVSSTYGQYIKINHGSQVYTIYGGLDEILVKPLEKVKKGQQIASVAAGEGNCLSFELWVDGEVADPAGYISF